jgi:hypothetical protein
VIEAADWVAWLSWGFATGLIFGAVKSIFKRL